MPQSRYGRFGVSYIIITVLEKYTIFFCVGQADGCVVKHLNSSGNSWGWYLNGTVFT